jgi:putative PEP-CTERM system histidine kinase
VDVTLSREYFFQQYKFMFQIIVSAIAIVFAATYSIHLLRKKNRGLSSALLVCALAAVAALEFFDLLAVIFPDDFMFWKRYSMVAEGLLVPAWLLFSLTFARELGSSPISLRQRILVLLSCAFLIAALSLPAATFFYSPDFAGERALFLDNPGFIFYIGVLVFLVIALVNLETTLVSASHGSRYKIKYEIVGAVALLAVLLLYYSQAFLYRTIDMNLMPVRTLIIIVSIALMAYSRLVRGDGVRICVSKQMAFRSIVLLAVGIYLVGLGLMGEGMKYFGESFGRSVAMALAFLAGIGMVIVLLSETAKRKVKLFLHKNFYQHKYDYRSQWLQFTDRLSSSRSDDDLLRSIVSGFTEVFGMACGALFLYDGDRQVYYVAAEMEKSRTDLVLEPQDPVIAEMRARHSLVNLIDDDANCELGSDGYFVRNGISFVIPLIPAGSVEGFVAIGRPVNKNEAYNYEDYDLMTTLARQAGSAILNLRLSEELSRAREMEALGKLSTFVLHDLKNLVSTLALVVGNAKLYIGDPEFQSDMLESLDRTVAKMNALILRLKKLRDKGCLNREAGDLLDLCNRTTGLIASGEIRVSGEPVSAEIDAEEIQKVLLNLVINSLEASNTREPVMVEVGSEDMAYIKVTDRGCGMPDDFLRHRLFKPFSTTKKKGLGIGLYQCRQIVEAHGGKIEVASEVGKGTTFTVFLPKVGEADVIFTSSA